ncbi:MAG: hypothetical protein KDB72_14705 [Mycobacterium sp.]|nr:hypothetical protein [Mycobacterium sp.]
MSPALNLTTQGIEKAEYIEAYLNEDTAHTAALFDPAWSPVLHDILVAEIQALHALEREGGNEDGITAEYKTFRGETYNPHDPDDGGVVLLKWPHDRRIFVCRSNADRFGAMLDNMGPSGICDVQIVEDCHSLCLVDQPIRPLPIACGRVVLMFEICLACEAKAGQMAETNFKISVMEAQAKLLRDATIDPGSRVPPRP